ncbi:MAG: twin-arginine translocation signal domain-containing protein [Chloroflexi bacterium]|nr:MAG: hypothetical protein AUH76_18210 [Candidatus Rokubacteria bacterium 13_1_40CM_4_67_11]TMD44688.1 MAG: twin-arginine translocation signal domain-containing protein [Chloroflexota bacterium]TME23912.1 MAG: twin-arginine translocation signal domain-containing protein [Chloroflexota bacterium]
MDDRKLSRRQLLKAAGALGVAAAALDPIKAFADDDEGSGRVSWDIINVVADATKPNGLCIVKGGSASATATNGPHKAEGRITVTGHGTFPNADKCSKNVTGGGTWSIVDSSDDPRCFSGSGNYHVTELLSWRPAVGTLPIGDCTGEAGTPSSGLAVLRVLYSNGRRGTLTVSCHLPANAPACMFEGITASMEHEDFWQNEAADANPLVPGNRTVFHIRRNGESDD